MDNLSPEYFRKQFAELTAKSEAIKAKSAPLRADRDDQINKAREATEAHNKKIATVEEGLYEIEQARAICVRALGGQTADPAKPPAEEDA